MKTPKLKAYTIDLEKVMDGFLYTPIYIYSEKLSKAKSQLFNSIRYDGYKLYGGDEVTYLNIPVVRATKMDKVEFEGDTKTILEIDSIEKGRKRIKELDEILNNPTITHCYILKRGTYYRPNSCGYTGIKSDAGIYTKEDAVLSGRRCEELYISPIDRDEHNKMIYDKINELKGQLI